MGVQQPRDEVRVRSDSLCSLDGDIALRDAGVGQGGARVGEEICGDEVRMGDEVVPHASEETVEDDGVAIRVEAEAVDGG